MGRQVEFFMYDIDEFEFLKMTKENGGFIVNKHFEQIEIEALNYDTHICYIIFPMSSIVKSKGGFVDEIDSEVIQYSRCLKMQEKTLRSGRIWAEFKFYNDNNKLDIKGEWFTEKFNLYAKWIKKNSKFSKCKHYYIGKYTYEKYYNLGYKMMAGPKDIIEF